MASPRGIKRKRDENDNPNSNQFIADELGIDLRSEKRPKVDYQYLNDMVIPFERGGVFHGCCSEISISEEKRTQFKGLLAWDIDESLVDYSKSIEEKQCHYHFLEKINALNQFAYEQGYVLVVITARDFENAEKDLFMSALNILNGLGKGHISYLYFVGNHELDSKGKYELATLMANKFDKTINGKLFDEINKNKNLPGIKIKSALLTNLRQKFNLSDTAPSILIDDQKGHIDDCEKENHFGVLVSKPISTAHFDLALRVIKGEFGCDTKAYYRMLRGESRPLYGFTPLNETFPSEEDAELSTISLTSAAYSM